VKLYFQSYTPSDSEFLRGTASHPTIIDGVLTLPLPEKKPSPLVILLHGSGGRGPLINQWVRRLQKIGIGTFAVDSFTGRGLTSVRDNQDALGRLVSIMDAYSALDFCSKMHAIDKSKIAVMGFSRGGQGALYASVKRFQRMHLCTSLTFRAYVALYPNCTTRYIEDNLLDCKPISVHHGDADDYNPASATQIFCDRAKSRNANITLHRYDDAHHVFDWDALIPAKFFPEAQSTVNCQVEEISPGLLINARTGVPFSYNDSDVIKGATMGFSPKATKNLIIKLNAFFKENLLS
jgi:dienelactone hydrolase